MQEINVTPSQEFIKECFEYCKSTGDLTWSVRPEYHFSEKRYCDSWNKNFAGRLLKGRTEKGYCRTSLTGKYYFIHRLIFKMMTGRDPLMIDHINGVPSDNRWENLRDVTAADNSKNIKLSKRNKSGLLGVVKRSGSWRVRITARNNRINLGSYGDYFEAACARKSAENKFGFHENHGRIAQRG